MTDVTLFGSSPFDAIRRVDEAGEYWTGRDLAPAMGYLKWENFAAVIGKARDSLGLVQGSDTAAHHFLTAGSDGGRWGNLRLDDYRLTRFAAYLVAMAGDDTKEPVAEARIYFAVRAREAEVSKPVLPDLSDLDAQLVFIDRWREAVATSIEQARQLEAAAPKVEAFDSYMDAENALSMGAVANQLGIGRNTMMRRLRADGVLQRDNRPYQRYAQHFKVVAQSYEAQDETRATHTTKVKPSGVELIRKVLSGGKALLSIPGGVAS